MKVTTYFWFIALVSSNMLAQYLFLLDDEYGYKFINKTSDLLRLRAETFKIRCVLYLIHYLFSGCKAIQPQ